jgi:hypothetical protein
MAATTSYGLRLGHASTSWKAYQVYFQTDPASCPYLFGLGRNRRFNTETFSVYSAALFWPMGRVSSLGPIRTCPRVGARPQHPCGRPPMFIYPLATTKNTRVLFRSSLAFATCL